MNNKSAKLLKKYWIQRIWDWDDSFEWPEDKMWRCKNELDMNRPSIVGDSIFWENTTMKRQNYTPEMKERAVRMLIEAAGDYPSNWSAIQAIAPKIGCTPETLRSWHKKHIDQTIPANVQAQNQEQRIKELERENKELKQANEIIRKAAAFFAQAELGRPHK